jgi:hypothetical protein
MPVVYKSSLIIMICNTNWALKNPSDLIVFAFKSLVFRHMQISGAMYDRFTTREN